MGQLIRFYCWQMMTKFWIGLLLLVGFIGLVERQSYEGNFSIFVLKIITDHYFLIYLMTPIFLQCISKAYREPHMVELIRVRNFYRMIVAKWLAVVVVSALFVTSIVAVALLSSIGLDRSSNWGGALDDELKTYFMATFQSPIEGIFLSACFMVVGLSFIGSTFVTVAHYFSRKGAYMFVVASYLFMLIAFKMPWFPILKELSMSRFIILHHNYTGTFTWQGTIFIAIVGIIVQFVIVKRWWNIAGYAKGKRPLLGKGLLRYYGLVIFTKKSLMICIIGLLVLVTTKAAGREETLQEFIVRFFYGYQNGNVHLFTWLEQVIYIGIPVYLIAIFMQEWLVKRDWQMYIRLQQKKQWIHAMLALIGIFALSYVLLTLFMIIGASLLFDKAFILDGTQLMYMLYMKLVEISTILGLLFLLFVLTNKVTLSFLSVMGLYVLNFLPFKWTNYNIAGLSQLVQIEELNLSMLSISMMGVIYVTIVLLLIGCSYKKYFMGR